MKKLIIAVLLAVALFIVSGRFGLDIPTSQPLSNQDTSNTSPQLLSDSDSDGLNSWFEENIAGYDPNIPNDRYIIIYFCFANDPNFSGEIADSYYDFFVEKGHVPPENIVLLKKEEANATNLRGAIEKIASKSDENDIVFLFLNGHGGEGGIEKDVKYTALDGWLDQIEAKAVITTIMACGCESALPVLKDGPCPRIVFVQSAGEFIGMLGADPEYAFAADTKYGNNDGYVSLKEIGELLDYDPFWGNDWGRLYQTYDELYAKGRSFVEVEGYSKVSDTSNIASKIYLTDYYYKTDFTPETSERQPYNWIYYKP